MTEKRNLLVARNRLARVDLSLYIILENQMVRYFYQANPELQRNRMNLLHSTNI
jgi:hypothetical protein